MLIVVFVLRKDNLLLIFIHGITFARVLCLYLQSKDISHLSDMKLQHLGGNECLKMIEFLKERF